ncbi:MAG: hypothetical protein HY051_05355 [Candidatus Aenigmarchaeota archaeon]|nr:hypothetical protein [Candidatus Aenigmarchaeota archaeon]
MQEIITKDFIKSKRAKRLPEILKLDEEFAYLLGLWKADRSSTAKGIVGLISKDEELLNVFRKFFELKLKMKAKERVVIGYGLTKEVYVCSMPFRRILEFVSQNRLEMLKDSRIILSYIAGLIDGDGSTGGMAHLVIFYGKKEKEDAEKDRKLILSLGFNTTLNEKENHLRLYILRPSKLLQKLTEFIVLKRKLVTWRDHRTRPISNVANLVCGQDALIGNRH